MKPQSCLVHYLRYPSVHPSIHPQSLLEVVISQLVAPDKV